MSVKMIFMAYKNNVFNKEISKELQAIKKTLDSGLINEIKKGEYIYLIYMWKYTICDYVA